MGLPRVEVFEEKEERKHNGIMDRELEDGEAKSPKLTGNKEKEMEIEMRKDKSLDDKEEHSNRALLNERFRSDSFRYEFESPGFAPRGREGSIDIEPLILNTEASNT